MANIELEIEIQNASPQMKMEGEVSKKENGLCQESVSW
jgi:hypothetical protein